MFIIAPNSFIYYSEYSTSFSSFQKIFSSWRTLSVVRDFNGYINLFGIGNDKMVHTASEKKSYESSKFGELQNQVQVTSIFYNGIIVVSLSGNNEMHFKYTWDKNGGSGWTPWLLWSDWNSDIKAKYIELGYVIETDDQGGYGIVVKTVNNQVKFSWMVFQNAFAPWTNLIPGNRYDNISIKFGSQKQIFVESNLKNTINTTVFNLDTYNTYPPSNPGPDYPPTYCWPDKNLDPQCGTAL